MSSPAATLLSADVSVDYKRKPGVLNGVRIDIVPGEIVGLVGESGSGKSTLALALMGLLEHARAQVGGSIRLFGRELIGLKEREMRGIRGRLISLIPQSPAAALNPALRIGTQLREAWVAHSREPWPLQAERLREYFRRANLPEDPAFLKRFPSHISVGQAQRVLIVMALLHSPALLVADEPTSALDVITQREALGLLSSIGASDRRSMLFISHDLPAVASVCTRLAILHDGVIVEDGPPGQVVSAPQHVYTKRLVSSVPRWL